MFIQHANCSFVSSLRAKTRRYCKTVLSLDIHPRCQRNPADVVKIPTKEQPPSLKSTKSIMPSIQPREKPLLPFSCALISCQVGLEGILSEELRQLFIEHCIEKGGARVMNTRNSPNFFHDLMRCHLHVGTASRILMVHEYRFNARSFPELRRKIRDNYPWGDILTKNCRIKVKATCSKSKLLHSRAVEERVQEEIAASLNQSNILQTTEPNENTSGSGCAHEEDGVMVRVNICRDTVEVMLDSSWTPLHQRGYRFEVGKAPLREDLAFALLRTAGWRSRSPGAQMDIHDPTEFPAFLDPFCGSGTIAIEAAAMARGLAPGRLRPAPFNGTLFYDPDAWAALVASNESEALQLSRDILPTKVSASDRDAGVVKQAKSNAARAGVSNLLDIQQSAFSSHPWLDDPLQAPRRLFIVSNLPFGRRLEAKGESRKGTHVLWPLYQTLTARIDRLVNNGVDCSVTFLTDDHRPLSSCGCQHTFQKAFASLNGGIPVVALSMTTGVNPVDN